MSAWAGQRVLVTGPTGFIGARLTLRLIECGAEVWAGVHPSELAGAAGLLPAGVRVAALEVQEPSSVRQAVDQAQPEVVFHLAAAGVSDRGIAARQALRVNVLGAVHLLEALQPEAVRRVILVGTCHEYGQRETPEGLDPCDFYAASKAAAWAFGRAFWRATGLPVVTVRLFQVYGPGQPERMLVPAAIRAALTGADFPTTPGEQQRDFIYITDVVDGLLAAAQAAGVDGQSLDLGTGVAQPVRGVVERIWELADAKGRALMGALPYRQGEAMRLVADADRTAALTGWRARTGLDLGLRQTIYECSRAVAR
ncbi:MAG: NAD(P)-dependent oxidoreductase [Anaerolineales bacterium]|nr:NAD(P)-dependent oxidoreductase [Anaerolineales bacterium]